MNAILIILGSLIIAWILSSALRTVVVPRPTRVLLSMAVFTLVRKAAFRLAARIRNNERREQLLATLAPATLLVLPGVWSAGLIGGFALVYSGLDIHPWQEALALSGSSLTTLGFVSSNELSVRLVAAAEALLGLGIVALMISFLPTIYSSFSRREVAIGRLVVRAGDPPDPVQFIVRSHRIGELGQAGTPGAADALTERWATWEEWFVEIGETHTTFPALALFRSSRGSRSWVGAAEAALDTAALLAALDFRSTGRQESTMIRSGYLALRDIADFFGVVHDPDPSPSDPISVDRDDFEYVLDVLSDSEVIGPDVDRDQAWLDFAGWRVNYDTVLTEMAQHVAAPPSHWELRRIRR